MTVQKLIDRIARFQIFHQNAHGNPGAGKNWRSTKDFGIFANRRVGHGAPISE